MLEKQLAHSSGILDQAGNVARKACVERQRSPFACEQRRSKFEKRPPEAEGTSLLASVSLLSKFKATF